VVITQTDSVSSEYALSIGVTWGGGRRDGGQVPFQYILYLRTVFFSGYWFEVEIHMVNLARPTPNIIHQITPMVVSIKTVI